MSLYVGGTEVISNINSPVSGKYTATFDYVEVTDILHDYELLTRGYILTGYKSGQCQDDVNKTIYATNTTHHLAATINVGNYHGGWSGTQTAVAITANSEACQGSPGRSGGDKMQSFDMNTDTKIQTSTMGYSRYTGSYWTQTDVQRGYVTLGGYNNTERYIFSTDSLATIASCSAGTNTYFMASFPGSTYGHTADNANSTWQSMHNTNETFQNSGIVNSWYLTGVNPASHTKQDMAYTGNQAVGNVRRYRDVGNGGAIIHTSHDRWPPHMHNGSQDNFYGEENWMKGNYLSRGVGGYDGIQHNKAVIINNGTDTSWGNPHMDGFGDYATCSASAHWA